MKFRNTEVSQNKESENRKSALKNEQRCPLLVNQTREAMYATLHHKHRQKISLSDAPEVILSKIVEAGRMKGFDQQTVHHALQLEEHGLEACRNAKQDEFLQTLPLMLRKSTELAALTHDVAKTFTARRSPLWRPLQARQYGLSYPGHEARGREILSNVLQWQTELPEVYQEFILSLVEVSSNGLLKSIDEDAPEHERWEKFAKFVRQALSLPGTFPLENGEIFTLSDEEKLKVALSFNRADKLAATNKDSDLSDPHILQLKSRRERQAAFLVQLRDEAKEVLIHLEHKGLLRK